MRNFTSQTSHRTKARMAMFAMLLMLGLLAGCITHKKTRYIDESRMPVDFENDVAGKVFYEGLSRYPGVDNNRERHTKFAIPVILSVEDSVTVSDSARFNEAVRRADTNQDGIITEQEARIFAKSF